jgi:hypothetical protein
MKEFNRKDLNTEILANKAFDEARQIHRKSSTAQGRSLEEIFKVSVYGLAAEQFLIERCNFADNPDAYQDVISPEGIKVEVKVTKVGHYVPHVLGRLKDKRRKYPNLYQPDWVFIYINDMKSTEYKMAGTYMWNDNRYLVKDWYEELDREFLANYEGAKD